MYIDNLAETYNKLNSPQIARIRLTGRQLICLAIIVVIHISVLLINTLRVNSNFIADFALLFEVFLLTLLILIPSFYASFFAVYMKVPRDILFPVSDAEFKDENLPFYTILCPLYREGNIVRNTIKVLSEIDYPVEKLEVLLLLEEEDADTKQALPQYLPPPFKVVEIPPAMPKGKPRALNHGLVMAQGEFLAVYDAEDAPMRSQLMDVVKAFRAHGDEVWAVQARLCYDNPDTNWLSLLFYAEFLFWFDHFLPYLLANGYPVSLGGTSNHFRVDKIREIGGWDAFNVTEDADMTLRIFERNKKIILLQSQSFQHSPTRLQTWIRQRARWLKGLIQTVLVHSRKRSTIILSKYFSLILMGVITTINIFALTTLLFSSLVGPYNDLILKLWVVALAAPLVPQIVCYSWILRDYRSNLKLRRLFFPGVLVYWLMYMCASLYAIYQLITCPFHWEKTDHGPRA